jgi:hypothetical protein
VRHFLFGATLIAFVLINGPRVQANQCAQVFSTEDAQVAVLPEDVQAIQHFQAAQQSMGDAETIEEVTSVFYHLAQAANNILDHIVDNILIVETKKLNKEAKQVFTHSSQMLFSFLSQSTQIPPETLEQVVHQRYQIDRANLEERRARLRERASFIGYVEPKEDLSQGEELSYPIGFYSERTVEPVFEEDEDSDPQSTQEQGRGSDRTGDHGLEAANKNTGPIGFRLPIGSGDPEPQGKSPIGFVHFAEPTIEESNLPQLILDMERGLFDINDHRMAPGFRP